MLQDLLRSHALAFGMMRRAVAADLIWLASCSVGVAVIVLLVKNPANSALALAVVLPATSLLSVASLLTAARRWGPDDGRAGASMANIATLGLEFFTAHFGLLVVYALLEMRLGPDPVGQVRGVMTLFAPATVVLMAVRTTAFLGLRNTAGWILAVACCLVPFIVILSPPLRVLLSAIPSVSISVALIILLGRLADIVLVGIIARLRRENAVASTLTVRAIAAGGTLIAALSVTTVMPIATVALVITAMPVLALSAGLGVVAHRRWCLSDAARSL